MIKRNSSGSLYGILYDQLVSKIISGEWKPNDRIPTEHELCEIYDVSRITVRRALDEMLHMGLIRREIGRGTFVESSLMLSPRQQIYSFTKEIEAMGFKPGIKLEKQKLVKASREVAADLRIEEGDEVLFVSRLRTADDQPLFVGESHINTIAFPQLLTADFQAISLARLIDKTIKLKVTRVEQWVTACVAGVRHSKLLGLDANSPVLKMKRIVYVEGDLPVESVQAYFNPLHYTNYSEINLS